MKLSLLLFGICATALIAFNVGRESMRAEMLPVLDQSVSLLADCMERNVIASCDCPGPEECDMQATCNRDALACCFDLARLQEAP